MSTPLAQELRQLIATDGPLSVERYMALCLLHPTLGYYTTRDPLGAAGDFTTAPEVSQIFGELIGLWAAEVWRMMGAPDLVHVVELGPGRGTLIADALRAARVLPAFGEAISLHLVEASPVLRQRQRARLAQDGFSAVTWHDRLEDVPEGPLILIANEFYDALPVRQYVRGARGWHERMVGLGPDDGLMFGLAAEPEAGLAATVLPDAAPGAVLEVSRAGAAVTVELARRLVRSPGAALIIDYGHVRSAAGDTLQAMRGHAFVDALAEPGLADLTTHVDFDALARTALRTGAAVDGPVEQGAFLEALGAATRTQRLMRDAGPERQAELMAAYRRLVGPGKEAMGSLFKVMALASPALPPLPGLAPRRPPPDMGGARSNTMFRPAL